MEKNKKMRIKSIKEIWSINPITQDSWSTIRVRFCMLQDFNNSALLKCFKNTPEMTKNKLKGLTLQKLQHKTNMMSVKIVIIVYFLLISFLPLHSVISSFQISSSYCVLDILKPLVHITPVSMNIPTVDLRPPLGVVISDLKYQVTQINIFIQC